MFAIRSRGSGAAMSHTKSHSPCPATRSTMDEQIWRMVASCSRTRRGVKPLFTSLRRRVCAGSSIEIIIGSGSPCGRGALKLENVAASFSMVITSW